MGGDGLKTRSKSGRRVLVTVGEEKVVGGVRDEDSESRKLGGREGINDKYKK